jgi:uncharacterized membrane protein YphA (DoxX/SURF4 family)
VHKFVWALQILLAISFIVSGTMKLTSPKRALQPRMGFVEDFSERAVKGIGAAEVLGALGLILPATSKIATVLTPLAAVGLALLMAGAIYVHVRREEGPLAAVPAVLLVLCLIVAWARFGPYAF